MAAAEFTNGSVLTNGASLNGDAAGDTGAAVAHAEPISAGKQTGSPNVGQQLMTGAQMRSLYMTDKFVYGVSRHKKSW